MRHRIGVMDSGMGGLTVVRGIYEMNAPVDIVYAGDNANVPYGNRSLSEIVELSVRMLRNLETRCVEAVAIACNTISATVETLRRRTALPLIDIISLGAEFLAARGEPEVGLFATEFTVKSGMHAALAKARNPAVHVHGVASATLAALIDSSIDDEAAIRAEIASMLAKLETATKGAALGVERAASSIRTVLLGCTHYPIVMGIFNSLAPDIEFIDPARLQARAVLAAVGAAGRNDIEGKGGVHDTQIAQGAGPSLDVITSGSPDMYRTMLKRLGVPQPSRIDQLALR